MRKTWLVMAIAFAGMMLWAATTPPMVQATEQLVPNVAREPEPYRTVLAEEIKWLTKSFSTHASLDIYEPIQVTVNRVPFTASMRENLPGYRFYRIRYTHKRRADRPYGENEHIRYIPPVESYTYLISPTGKHFKTLALGRGDDDFIKLLRAERITVRSAQDARRIWILYQDACGNISQSLRQGKQRQVSARVWEFGSGIWEHEGQNGKPIFHELYYRVVLNADRTVASIKELERPVKGRGGNTGKRKA